MPEDNNGFSGDTIKFQKTNPNHLLRSANGASPDTPTAVRIVAETTERHEVVLPKPTVSRTKKEIVQQPDTHIRTSKREAQGVSALRTQCKQLGVSVFLQENASVRSLGFTSAIDGEGKSFLAGLTAQVLAEDMKLPVTLLECNWEHPSFNQFFNLTSGPGLAEWLYGESTLDGIRRPVSNNLTVITAGDGRNDSVKLLQAFRQRGVLDILKRPGEVLIVDLPSTVTTEYGQLAARLVDSLILVVRMGVTPDAFVAEASRYLKDAHVHGVILNQISSRIPRWLRQAL